MVGAPTLSLGGIGTGDLPPFLSLRECAALLRRSEKAIRNLHDKRKLPGARKLGGRILVETRVLLAAIREVDAP